MKNLYQRAFGKFDIQNDPDFPTKFVLDIIFRDEQFDMLIKLLNHSLNFDIWAGDPGWEIEIKKENNISLIWPCDALFRISIDPDEYWTAHPEVYLSEKKLFNFVEKIALEYLQFKKTTDFSAVRKILELVNISNLEMHTNKDKS